MYDRMIALGWWFGYPDCCTQDFIYNRANKTNNQIIAGRHTGFIPCKKHADDILNKTCTLESLIANRYHNYQFPMGYNTPSGYELKQLYSNRMLF